MKGVDIILGPADQAYIGVTAQSERAVAVLQKIAPPEKGEWEVGRTVYFTGMDVYSITRAKETEGFNWSKSRSVGGGE